MVVDVVVDVGADVDVDVDVCVEVEVDTDVDVDVDVDIDGEAVVAPELVVVVFSIDFTDRGNTVVLPVGTGVCSVVEVCLTVLVVIILAVEDDVLGTSIELVVVGEVDFVVVSILLVELDMVS